MARTVWKFKLLPGHHNRLLSPDARVVGAGVKDGEYWAWIEHDPDHGGKEYKELVVHGTGHDIAPGFAHQVSFADRENGLVWHVYGRGFRWGMAHDNG